MSTIYQSNLVTARGPLMLISVLIALIIPKIQNVSASTLAACSLLTAGSLLTIHDVIRALRTHLRNSIQRTLDDTVLDNLLRSIFDPETGWIACLTGLVMGNACMYTLPMNDSQRIQLVQSTLGVEESEAQVILQSPGGIKQLLPEPIKNWLGSEKAVQPCEDKDDATWSTDATNLETEPSQEVLHRDDEATSVRDGRPHEIVHDELIADRTPAVPGSRSTATPDPAQTRGPTTGNSPLPINVLAAIVRELLGERIKKIVESVPNSALLVVGASSTVGLLLHLRSNVRARRLVCVALECVTTLSLSSLATASLAALLAKSSLSARQPTSVGAGFQVSRILRFVDRRRWQCFIAFLVMFFIKQRRRDIVRKLR